MFPNKQKPPTKPVDDKYPELSKYGRNLTELAMEGKLDPVIGRTEECNRIMQVLSRRRKNCPCLSGQPGIGKTAVVEALALRIASGDVPSGLKDKQIYELSLTELISGAAYRGEFEERLQAVIKEVTDSNGEIILFIDEAHLLLGLGSSGDSGMDAANILKPALARGQLKVIAATTEAEYRKYIEKDAALERRFTNVLMLEPSVDQTISILRGIKDRYESHHGVKIKDSALVAAAQLSDRYITHRKNPDKSIDLIDEACSNIRIQLDSQPAIIDELDRKLLVLRVEETALRQELTKAKHDGIMGDDEKGDGTPKSPLDDDDDDAYSISQTKQRLQRVLEQILSVEQELTPLKEIHQQARGKVNDLRAIKSKLSDIEIKLQKAEREKDLARAADLKYNVLPELKEKLKKVEKEVEEEKKKGSAVSGGAKKNQLISEIVDATQIALILSRNTGIPVSKLTQSERSRILSLEDELNASVIGQSEAVKSVSDAILRSRAGFNSRNQPLASFLFCGSTGVGKTELAKKLASVLFDSEKNLRRFDMSEYGEQHAVSRLIGAAPGYVGYEEGGQLTEAVRKNPYQVLLFDEVEKAHKSIWNVFLQVLDDGRLTDSQGRTVDFSNTIIIFTSNLGSDKLLKAIDIKTGKFKHDLGVIKEQMMFDLRAYFRPEMLNRFSDLIVFTPLTRDNISQIINLQLVELSKRFASHDIRIEINQDTIDNVLMRVYDAQYGARVIKRFIERVIVTQLSKSVLKGVLKHHTMVRIGTHAANLQKLLQDTSSQDDGSSLGFADDSKDLSPSLLTFEFIPFRKLGIQETFANLPKRGDGDDGNSDNEETYDESESDDMTDF